MKKGLLTLLTVSAITLASPVHAKDEKPWYGLLPIETFPHKNCKITNFLAVASENTLGIATAQDLQKLYTNLEKDLVKELKKYGWNTVLGYRKTYLGGAGGIEYKENYATKVDILTTGIARISGLAVKLNCK